MKSVLLDSYDLLNENHIGIMASAIKRHECLEPYFDETYLLKLFIYNDDIKKYKIYSFNKYGFNLDDLHYARKCESPQISKFLYYCTRTPFLHLYNIFYPRTRRLEFHKFVYDIGLEDMELIFNAAIELRSIELLEYIKPSLINIQMSNLTTFDSDWKDNDESDVQILEWLIKHNLANFSIDILSIYDDLFGRITNPVVLNYFGRENCYSRGELVHVGVKRQFINDKNYLAELDLLYSQITPILAEIFIPPIRKMIESYAFC